MKHLILLLIFQGSLDSFAQDTTLTVCWEHNTVGFICDYCKPAKPDTIPEWVHVNTTRAKGFVMARKALSVRAGGICITHLDCEGKPFPVHYRVGWCEGRETLLNRLVNQLKYKQ